MDNEDRLLEPLVRLDGTPASPGWNDTLAQAAESLQSTAATTKGEMAVLVSGRLTNEELHFLKRVFTEQLPGSRFYFSALTPYPETEDNILRKKDKNPNTRGAELIGLGPGSADIGSLGELKSAAREGKLAALYLAGHDLPTCRSLKARNGPKF